MKTIKSENNETTPYLLHQEIKTPDGTHLISEHRHDYKTHKDANGETYMIDGGTDYARRSVNTEPAEDLSLYSCMDHTYLREKLVWGTYGIDGDQPLTYIALKDMTTPHIEAVLKLRIGEGRAAIYLNEIEFRK